MGRTREEVSSVTVTGESIPQMVDFLGWEVVEVCLGSLTVDEEEEAALHAHEVEPQPG